MANYQTTAKTYAVDPFSRSEQIGRIFNRSGQVIIDSPLTVDPTPEDPNPTAEVCSWIVCGTGGNVVFQHKDGKYGYFPSATAGQLLPIGAIKIVASHTFTNGGTLTTTAANLWWYGGV